MKTSGCGCGERRGDKYSMEPYATQLTGTRHYLYGRILGLRNTNQYSLVKPLVNLFKSLSRMPYADVVSGDIQALLGLMRATGYADTNNNGYGSTVWLPNGVELMRLLSAEYIAKMKQLQYEEYTFPSLVSLGNFNILSDNIYDFSKNAFTVSRGDMRAVLRPTGEAIIYPVVASWLREDFCTLPLRLFQVGPYYRYKSAPHPYLRPMDSALMIEAHGFFSDRELMSAEFSDAIVLSEELAEILCVDPYVVSRPTDFNKPVSEETVAFDVLLPNDKTIQTLLVYMQGQVFSRPFNIQSKKTKDFTYQVTYGLTERTIYTTLFIHADVLGLRMPARLAPVQVAIVTRDSTEATLSAAQALYDRLVASGVRTRSFCDTHESKFTDQLIAGGIPLILFLDEQLVNSDSVELFDRRDLSIVQAALSTNFVKVLTNGDAVLKTEQIVKRASRTERVYTIEEVQLSNAPCAEVFIHNSTECIDIVQRQTDGECLGVSVSQTEAAGRCIACKRSCSTIGYIARRV